MHPASMHLACDSLNAVSFKRTSCMVPGLARSAPRSARPGPRLRMRRPAALRTAPAVPEHMSSPRHASGAREPSPAARRATCRSRRPAGGWRRW